MTDLGNNVLCEKALLHFTTTVAQRDFVFEKLLPTMKAAGEIESAQFSEFVRKAIEEASKRVGLEPVRVARKAPGRKPGKRVSTF